VLVVEDDESTALFVTRVLSRNGFVAAWVMSAEQASARLDTEPFDVLLADYRLPGQSGIELARDIRGSMPGIGIAVMTSFAESDTEDTARENGADDFFEKPLHPSNLVSRIGDLVTRSRTSGGEVSRSHSRETIQALPMAPAPAFSSTGVISGPSTAGSGSDERTVPRDTASAPPAPAGHWG
jgi:DNA-binding response OmpR family regulator